MSRPWTVVLALTAVGGLLRFATLDAQSFWLDELVTVSLLERDFGGLLEMVPESEGTPYLYYVLAWSWAQVFGLGEIGLRSLSALVGTAAIPVTYLAGAQLASRRAGLVAAALVSVHPFLVWYSQEARAYSLLVLLAAAGLLFFARALAARPRALAWWALISSLAVATHYFAAFLVVPEALWLLARARSRPAAAAAAAATAVVAALHLPLALDQRDAASAVSEGDLWRRVAGVPKALVVGYSFPLEIAGTLVAALLVVLGALLVARASGPERRGALLAGGLAAVVVVVPALIALAGADYVTARNAVVAVVPAAILAGTGFATSRLGLAAAGALCALGLAISLTVSLDDRYGRTNWRAAAQRLGPAEDGRALVVTPYLGRQLWSPYLPGLDEPAGARVSVREIAVVGLATEGGYSSGPVRPPAPDAGARPPSPFGRVRVERTGSYTIVVYQAPRPMSLATDDLRALALADVQPVVLLQPRGSP